MKEIKYFPVSKENCSFCPVVGLCAKYDAVVEHHNLELKKKEFCHGVDI